MEVIKLTESLLRKMVIQEISDQLKTNAMMGSYRKSQEYRTSGDEGMAIRKDLQSDAFLEDLTKSINAQGDYLYKDDRSYVKLHIYPKYDTDIIGASIKVRAYVDGYEGWYVIEYDEARHEIVKEKEEGDVRGTLLRVSNGALNAYNLGKKKLRSLVLGYANREGGPVGQYYVDNTAGRYPKIGDAMRASAERQKQHADIYYGDKGSNLYGVKKIQPLKEDAKCSMEFINGCFYSVNGTKCLYNDGLFFWESEDGTKWFRAETLKNSNAKIEAINN